ncbi:MAG: NYN domain-containing protein [Clostridia bacterium]|nr:NYN domain-containing protein [Clostridia bacterium]
MFKKMTPVSVKQKAVAFVDFEHWYISMEKMYGQKPDIMGWYNMMETRYKVEEIYFFADFSNSSIKAEIPNIRRITNFVIETQNTSAHYKKDFTDFIMLDHIYQKAMTASDTDVFIIFSGDGHFSSVVSFLANRMKKTVGIYGVRGAVSGTLRTNATWLVELPLEDKTKKLIYKTILVNLRSLEDTHGENARPGFRKTVSAASASSGVDEETVAEILREMIDKGYIVQVSKRVNKKSIKILTVDWKKVRKDRIEY